MKKLDQNIIRIGDIVKVINPEVFVRCGYPMTTEDAIRNHMTKADSDKIDDLMQGLGICGSSNIFPDSSDKLYENTFDKIVRALAYAIVGTKHCGGNERTIHTIHVPQITGHQYKVVDRKVVKTGTRIWEVDYDYYHGGIESAYGYLRNEKTHVIFTVQPIGTYPRLFESLENGFDPDTNYNTDAFRIEKINLEKIKLKL